MAKLNSGFTLIELMIVIAIISMVAALGVANYQTSLKKARDAHRKTDLQQIRSALEIYRADIGSYPTGAAPAFLIHGCGSPCGAADCTFGNKWECGTPTSTYIEKLPQDPKNVNYRYSSTATTYTLEACLEHRDDPQSISIPGENGWTSAVCRSEKIYQVKNP